MLNLALQKWRAGESSPGIWSNLPDIHTAEVLARLDVDWICFDLQHGLMDYSDLTRLLPAVSGLPITPLVRVAANQPDQMHNGPPRPAAIRHREPAPAGPCATL